MAYTKVKPPSYDKITMSQFFGADLRNAPSNVAKGRSPSIPNMIRDTKGNNKKRYGYETLLDLEGPFNGGHVLKLTSGDKVIIHDKNKIYSLNMTTFATTELYATANNAISSSQQINSKLYIMDGANYLVYDGTTVTKVGPTSYIPTIIIGRLYTGGGTALEPINLLQPKRIERFRGDGTNKTFPFTATNIDATTVTIQSLQAGGTFSPLVEGTDFTVNRTAGTFTLGTAKPTPVTGEDNLYVTYAKTITGYADRIEKNDIMKLYGLNGARDTLIVAGNPDFPHYDWYSKGNDPTYFGDTWYSVMGQDDAKIIGYQIINDKLVTLKDTEDAEATIRAFDYTNSVLSLKTQGSFQAAGALAKRSFASFDNEPLYVTTQKDISAITPSDVLGERFSQERSYYISPALAKEASLKDAYGIVHDGFYYLAVGDKIYILDSVQPIYEENTPYSNRQYECYYWTGIGARVLWVYDDRMYFGTADGKVKRFFNADDPGYLDDGEEFDCWFDTNEIYGSQVELQKTFTHLAVLLAAHQYTGCRIWFKIDGIWEMIFDYGEEANFVDFSNFDFSKHTFRTDDTPTLAGGDMDISEVLHTQIRFENSRNEPFGIYAAVLKYYTLGEYIV